MRPIKWIYPPTGNCPVQAEGWFMGYYFYFRSRGTTARIDFSPTEADWDKDIILARYELWHTKVEGYAGWLSHWFCRVLIWWGCLRWMIKRDKNETYKF